MLRSQRQTEFAAPERNRSICRRIAIALLVCACWLSTSLSTSATAEAAAGETPARAVAKALETPGLPDSASIRTVVEGDRAQVRARLLVSPEAGRAGVLFDLEPGWHLYWRNPGESGIAPKIRFEIDGHAETSTPREIEWGEIEWPTPRTFEEADGLFTTWGYSDSTMLAARLPSETSETGLAGRTLRAEVSALVCRTQCVPVEFSLATPAVPVFDGALQASIDRRFAFARTRLPIEADRMGVSAAAAWRSAEPAEDEEAQLVLQVSTCRDAGANCPIVDPGYDASLFFPIDGQTFEMADARLEARNDAAGEFTLALELTRLATGDGRLRGLVPIRSARSAKGELHFVSIDVPIEAADDTNPSENRVTSIPIPPITQPPGDGEGGRPLPITLDERLGEAEGGSATGWLQALVLAMLGGLILNGMPCVLPVLAIKIVALADLAERNAREVKLNGLAYTGGVLASMATLAGIVIGLRAAGHSVGWGFQFQEPLFVAAICFVLVTFALNLFGLFEIELGQGRLATVGQEATGLRRSVFEGLLAVVLATPCTAPFLGTAVGFAFASSAFLILGIFLAIGLGLAGPFLVVSFRPSLARFIPRSGPWMNTLRAGLGFSLLATVVWLLWVLGQGRGAEIVVAMTGVLLFLSFLLWIYGQAQPLRSVWASRASVVGIATIAFASINMIGFDRSDDRAEGSTSVSIDEGWAAYSEAAVADALAEGRPAFVVFTADWCITCKLNEGTVIERESTLAAFAARDVALFKADWTHRDEGIRRRLADFGRAGVPLYLLYHPDQPDHPQVLSELLSQREVFAALAKHDGGQGV